LLTRVVRFAERPSSHFWKDAHTVSTPRHGGLPHRSAGGKRRTDAGKQRTGGASSRGAARGGRDGRDAAAFPRRGAGEGQRTGDRTRDKAPPRPAELQPPDSADPSLLERAVRAELRSLSKPNAELVAKHLVAAGQLVDSDPRKALAHARAARARAARVAAVREAVGVAAYHAGEWAEALTELRTARRISGDPHVLPLIADTERALGRPEQAARLLSDPDVRRLDAETRAELLIVVAGARRDLGQLDAALAVLARGGLDPDKPRPGAARLWYAYADVLEALGRIDEAARWFAASAARDPDGELDAAERAAALL
jgi:tetratricopeptide (TPR) repeat protein